MLMTQTCLIEPFDGDTPSGPLYDDEITTICRFEEHRKKYLDSSGKEYVSSGKLYLKADFKYLKPDTKVTVDGIVYIVAEKLNHRGFIDSHVELVVV